jgi:ABC-2 type transport system ATP-binding protein
MNNILAINGISKSYGAFSLKDVSFTVPEGYICGFIGPNGAGKTTTIKAVLNIVRADAGTVELFGNAGGDDPLKRVGVVMDSPFYVDEWTISDVETVLSPFYQNWNSQKYYEYLRRFGIERGKKVKELSRGMKVKLQLAAALCHNAELLILDEPTSGLDPVARDEICGILREFVLDENRGVLFSTHITADLEKTADYIAFILGGQIVFSGAKEDLLEKYTRVTGGLGEINSSQKAVIIGYREHGTGFEGMIETAQIPKMPGGVLSEQITLDEIIIFMNKGAAINE